MSSRRLSSINLNQLVALDTLLAEGSVTRAAARLGVSQSALSHTLAGLRDLFGDPLLIRGGDGMVMSDRAQQLSGPLRRALTDLETLLDREPRFDPSEATREFRLATADFIAARVATHIMPFFAQNAPQARLTVRPLPSGSGLESLERGEVDAIIGPSVPLAASMAEQPWRDETFVCVVRQQHPTIGDAVDLETYVRQGHVLVSPSGGGASWVDRALAEQDLSRHVALRVASFLVAPMVVAACDLVLTAPQSAVEPFVDAFGLRRVAPPLQLASLPLMLSWHRRSASDPAQQWFRQLLADAG